MIVVNLPEGLIINAMRAFLPAPTNSRSLQVLAGSVFMAALPLHAGSDSLIPLGDLNTTFINTRAVGPGATLASPAYFAGWDSERGTEVWRTTGTSAPLFRDVRPGPESGDPSQFFVVGDNVVFAANDGVHGAKLYTTASISPSGLLADVQPGSTHPAPTILGSSNGWLWFTTPATSTSPSQRPATDLWVTNGTSSPQKRGSFAEKENSITNVTLLPNRASVVFLARSLGAPSGIVELFWADGSGAAQKIDTLRSNSSVHVPTAPVYAATTNFICYQFIDTNEEPMIYQLSTRTKSQLLDIIPGSNDSLPTEFVSNGTDRACFAATSTAGGREVWTTQGTPASTTQLADVTQGAASSNPTNLMMSRVSAGLFFQVENGAYRDLYFAEAGASPVFRICDSKVENTLRPTIVSAREIAYLKPEAGWFQIRLADGANGTSINLGPLFESVSRIWKTGAGPTGSFVYVVGSRFNGDELYRRSGGSLQLVSLPTPPGESAKPRNFFSFHMAEELFVADTSTTEGQLYRLDSGGAHPLLLLPPFYPFSSEASSHPAEFTEVADSLYFTALDGHDRRLFLSATGQKSSAINVPGLFDPEQLVAFQDRLFLLARSTAGDAGVKQVFRVEMAEGIPVVSIFDSPGHYATTLIAAAGRLFFVEPAGAGSELLQCISPDFGLETPITFYSDTAGIGISQLTANSGHLYFSAMEGSHPNIKRVIWGTDGTAASLVTPTTLVVTPQLLGTLGDACVFWNDVTSNDSYDAWMWDCDSGTSPSHFSAGPNYNAPEKHRVNGKPAGIEVDGAFFFTTLSGDLFKTDGTNLDQVYSSGSLKVRPESLTAVPGKLLFMATSTAYDNHLFSYSTVDGALSQIWSTSVGSLPCPLVACGGNLYFTASQLDYNQGSTQLWRTDGTVAGTMMIRDDLARRELANVPMGVYRGHLVLAHNYINASDDLEPALLNHHPEIPAPPLLTGGRRNQPFAFTYAEIVMGPPTDVDGDVLTALRLYRTVGTLTRNGVETGSSTDIAPGDTFVWTPPSGSSG